MTIPTIRPMQASDLSMVSTIQQEAYDEAYLERDALLRARLDASPETAWVATLDKAVSAYLVGYRAIVGRVTPLGAAFAPEPDGNCFYIHDLAVSASARGHGLGPTLARHALMYSARVGCACCALVAVQGSQAFWQRLGFAITALEEPAMRAILEGYGSDALYMVRQNGI